MTGEQAHHAVRYTLNRTKIKAVTVEPSTIMAQVHQPVSHNLLRKQILAVGHPVDNAGKVTAVIEPTFNSRYNLQVASVLRSSSSGQARHRWSGRMLHRQRSNFGEALRPPVHKSLSMMHLSTSLWRAATFPVSTPTVPFSTTSTSAGIRAATLYVVGCGARSCSRTPSWESAPTASR